ncbi:MAG: hypothetical protein IKY48_05145 [Bacteroidales bacterium]|nr:hypothetical protein [Bacteroidales bacterium]
MNRFFVKAAVAAVCVMAGFASCQKDVVEEISAQEMATLEISVPVEQTKVVGGADEAGVDNCQVFLFNDQGVLEAYASKDSKEIPISCTMGSKTVAVLVNAPAITDIKSLTQLRAKQSLLTHNTAESFVMQGLVSVNINTTKNVKIEVPVARMVAKVELASVVTSFEIAQYQNAEFKVSSVYLINVAADAKYFSTSAPTLWYNQRAYVSTDENALLYDDMEGVKVSSSEPYAAKNAFYAYPNPTGADSYSGSWTPRRTRLVVQATLDGQTYYYPVTLPALESNKRYEVRLTITRPGSYNPDTVVDKFAATVNVTIKDWEETEPVTEEI